MTRKASFTVTVDLDQTPGWGYIPADLLEAIQSLLVSNLGHYNPTTTLNEYQFRNYPCTDRTWAVAGQVTKPSGEGGGILEWCNSKLDAMMLLDEMSNYPEFTHLRVVQEV